MSAIKMKDVRRTIALLLVLASLTTACGDDEVAGGAGPPGAGASTSVVVSVPGDAPSPTATGDTEPADPEATAPGHRRSWSAADIRSAADAGGAMPQGGTDAVVRLLYLRGTSSDADGALGVAVRGDVAAVFADEVRSAATPLIGSDAIERAVTLHEVGHLLGLVDLFLATGRGDPEHPGHSSSRDSVMYWSVETGLFADLAGDLPQDFDLADLADLAAIRGG